MSKELAIELGEPDGEVTALQLFADGGTEALAATLQDGAETWAQDAKAAKLANRYDFDEDYRYAYYAVFARGARRVAEAVVSGERDGLAGTDYGDCLKRMRGVRETVIAVYEAAYKRGAAERQTAALAPSAVVSVEVPTIIIDAAPGAIGG